MNSNKQSLRLLIAAARKSYKPSPLLSVEEAPSGFSTRIAARWAEARPRIGQGDLWERLCWWGASVSTAVCLVAFAHKTLMPEPDPFDLFFEIQAVGAEPVVTP